jgi:hypothetical protein
MIKKSPRLLQNYMQAYQDRNKILDQQVDNKSELSLKIEEQYRALMSLPIFKFAALLEELLLQVRTMENMDEIKFGQSGDYKFARTAFPRMDLTGQHLRVYTQDERTAPELLLTEMTRIFNMNKMKLQLNYPEVLEELNKTFIEYETANS